MLYDSYLQEQIKIADSILDLNKRLDYLHKVKTNFTSIFPNSGVDAEGVKTWLADMINKTQFEIMRDIASRNNSSETDIKVENIDEQKENSLIFKNELLSNFYVAFNGYLWVDVELSNFMDWFREKPAGTPKFPKTMKTYFCYALGFIEDQRDVKLCPNFGEWIVNLIGNTNYSSLKNRAVVADKIDLITNKFNTMAILS